VLGLRLGLWRVRVRVRVRFRVRFRVRRKGFERKRMAVVGCWLSGIAVCPAAAIAQNINGVFGVNVVIVYVVYTQTFTPKTPLIFWAITTYPTLGISASKLGASLQSQCNGCRCALRCLSMRQRCGSIYMCVCVLCCFC
jgi:hypothetical protein